jgi:hypothetical protein
VKIKKYWWKFREWKPKIIQIILVFVFIGTLAGVASEKEWLFPLMWIDGQGINYIDLFSILFPQLMILKRICHKDYNPS